METFLYQKLFLCLFLLLIFLFSFLSFSSAQYTLPEEYFVNCGSSSSSTVYGRRFTGDQSTRNLAFSSDRSLAVSDTNTSSTALIIYQSARIFRQASSYEFSSITENGIYVVRFHFFPFSSLGNLSNARFNVITASGFSLLSNFSIQNRNFPLVEEFLLSVQPGRFRIYFDPSHEENSFAFVNAMEVFLAPPNFIQDSPPPPHINRQGLQGNYDGVLSGPIRVIHRINVGGQYIGPDNDTLLRNWIPDDNYLLSRNTSRNSTPYASRPEYQNGGATVFDAPDPVYQTAKELNIDNINTTNILNMSWGIDVRRRTTHLVRLHFCDIVSTSQNAFVFFAIFFYSSLGGVISPYNSTNGQLAVPFYFDYVIDSDDSGFLNISVGSQNGSQPQIAFLNGVEVIELVSDRGTVPDVGNSRGQSLILVISCSVGGGVVLVVLILVVYYLCLKKKKAKPVQSSNRPLATPPSLHSGTTNRTSQGSPLIDWNLSLKIPMDAILRATKNFDPSLKIGEGGFGKVYKGMMRNGTKVAVKRSEPGHGQGLPEFQTEVLLLSKIRHHHLVSLIGYCDEKDEMILVYEFMEKGTLTDHLYEQKGGSNEGSVSRSELSWVQRLEICIGAAKGIVYLHTASDRPIIHRDIKSTNILLDENYVAKVADFGLSRSGPEDQSYVSTEVKGSFGYLDPEYFRCLQLTQKSDVYSFGVVLLEVLCARPAIDHYLPRDQVNLADWGLSWQKKGEMEKIVDPMLAGKINPDSLRKFGDTVEKCLQESGADRPNMADVLWDLEYSLKLQNGMKREVYEDDATTGIFPTQVFQRLPADSITFGEDGLPHKLYSISSDADCVSDSNVFSQLNIGEAR